MYAPPPPEGPKKTPVWVWVIAAIGGVIILGVIAVSLLTYYAFRTVQEVVTNPSAAAALLAKIDPNLEVIDVDEDKKTLRVRNKKNNEEVTINLNDLTSGKFKISHEGKDGVETMEIGGKVKVPSWLPKYPGADIKGIGSMSSDKEGHGGMFAFETPDPAEKIHAFYRQGLEKEGFKVEQGAHSPGSAVLMMKAENDGGATITVTPSGSGSQVTVLYGRK
jgi:hypothetical protein